jgi:hypothetical protein
VLFRSPKTDDLETSEHETRLKRETSGHYPPFNHVIHFFQRSEPCGQISIVCNVCTFSCKKTANLNVIRTHVFRRHINFGIVKMTAFKISTPAPSIFHQLYSIFEGTNCTDFCVIVGCLESIAVCKFPPGDSLTLPILLVDYPENNKKLTLCPFCNYHSPIVNQTKAHVFHLHVRHKLTFSKTLNPLL